MFPLEIPHANSPIKIVQMAIRSVTCERLRPIATPYLLVPDGVQSITLT